MRVLLLSGSTPPPSTVGDVASDPWCADGAFPGDEPYDGESAPRWPCAWLGAAAVGREARFVREDHEGKIEVRRKA